MNTTALTLPSVLDRLTGALFSTSDIIQWDGLETLAYIFFSLLLVTLYWKLYRVQNLQSRSMELQSKAMVASFKPAVRTATDIEGETMTVRFRNDGQGTVRNCSVICQPYRCRNDSYTPYWHESETRLVPIETGLVAQHQLDDDDERAYNCEIILGVRNSDGTVNTGPLPSVIEQFVNDVLDSAALCGLDFYMTYENDIGHKFVTPLLSVDEISLDDAETLEDVVDSGTVVDRPLLDRTRAANGSMANHS